MKMELTIMVEVDGDYIPGCRARPIGDGTWDPGEGGQMANTSVKLDNRDITDLLDADALEQVEDAWLEMYESNP